MRTRDIILVKIHIAMASFEMIRPKERLISNLTQGLEAEGAARILSHLGLNVPAHLL